MGGAELYRLPRPTPEQFMVEQATEIARLKGLIDGTDHEFDCEGTIIQNQCAGYGKCNCIKSKVEKP